MAVAARELADELALTDRFVFFNEGWVPYDQRHNYLLEADIGVSDAPRPHRDRVLVPHPGTRLHLGRAADRHDRRRRDGEIIETRDLGLTVAAEDVEGLSDALHRLLDDEEFATECANAAELAPELTWSRVLQPLLAFCRAPNARRTSSTLRRAASWIARPASSPTKAPASGVTSAALPATSARAARARSRPAWRARGWAAVRRTVRR